MDYWLLKTEPACFSLNDLMTAKNQTTMWDGVRNYQARNFLRDSMKDGDHVLFYHSVTDTGIAGLCTVTGKPYPDPTQWNPEAAHFDPASTQENPRWFVVDITFVRHFPRLLPLKYLRTIPTLAGMELLRKGSRLSVQPVTKNEFECILSLAEED